MTREQSIECAQLITALYANTAGKRDVVNSYAKFLEPYPYRFTGETLVKMPEKHEGEFCPSLREILDAMCDRYRAMVRAALSAEAKRAYRTRYIPGDESHEIGFVLKYVSFAGLDGMSQDTCLNALRRDELPSEFVQRNSNIIVRPRDGGPIHPPKELTT
jgi:hypothetical protein